MTKRGRLKDGGMESIILWRHYWWQLDRDFELVDLSIEGC